jgi:hypothetical protein
VAARTVTAGTEPASVADAHCQSMWELLSEAGSATTLDVGYREQADSDQRQLMADLVLIGERHAMMLAGAASTTATLNMGLLEV